MRSFNISAFQAVVMFALGLVMGASLLSGMSKEAQAIPASAITGGVKATCTSTDAVADFVCRNTWMANSRYSYR
jgi:hypothetical protein